MHNYVNIPLSLSNMFTSSNEGLPRHSGGPFMNTVKDSVGSWSSSSTTLKGEVQRVTTSPAAPSPARNVIVKGFVVMVMSSADAVPTKTNQQATVDKKAQ